jgi:hypothetical protein
MYSSPAPPAGPPVAVNAVINTVINTVINASQPVESESSTSQESVANEPSNRHQTGHFLVENERTMILLGY